jgi:ribonuclease Z
MKFQVQILGSNSAFPAFGRFPSAQILNHNETLFLIDCGEGTQIQMTRYHIKRSKINQIFVSHLHGDHVFGLPGLITSYTQLGREKPIHIFGPVGIQKMMEAIMDLSGSRINFDIQYTELRHEGMDKIFSTSYLEVFAFPLKHRIATYGYRFLEKERPLRMKKEKITQYQLTTEQILDAKSGCDLNLNGQLIPVEELTETPEKPRSYAYCSDTAYDEKIIPFIQNTNLLYHETTFMEDKSDLAAYSKHSTTKEAGKIARMAKAGCLITGHYSSRYKDLSPLLEEVQSEFPNTRLGIEGEIYEVPRMHGESTKGENEVI